MSQNLLVFFSAIAPAIVLIFWIYKKDSRKPEPPKQLLRAFFLGILSVVVSLIFDFFLGPLIEPIQAPIISQVADAFLGAAIPEEAGKLILLWLFLRQNRFFDEYIDGIVYAVMIGMGFAATENMMYLFGSENWFYVGITRALISVPGHYAFAVLMGYFYSLAKFQNYNNKIIVALIYLAPVLAHGIFDSILMIMNILPYYAFILTMIFFFFIYKMHKFCSGRITKLQLADSQNS